MRFDGGRPEWTAPRRRCATTAGSARAPANGDLLITTGNGSNDAILRVHPA